MSTVGCWCLYEKKLRNREGGEVSSAKGYGTFIYIDNLQHRTNIDAHAHANHDQLPHHSAAQRRPRFCYASGVKQNKKKKEIYVTSEPANLTCRLLYMTPDE